MEILSAQSYAEYEALESSESEWESVWPTATSTSKDHAKRDSGMFLSNTQMEMVWEMFLSKCTAASSDPFIFLFPTTKHI